MELQQEILNLITSSEKYSLNIEKIASVLKMQKTSDFVNLNKAISFLEQDYQIVKNERNYYLDAHRANVAKGIMKINSYGKGFIEYAEGLRIQFHPDDLSGAMHLDEVAYSFDPTLCEGKVLRVIVQAKPFIIGTFHVSKSKRIFFDSDDYRVKKKIKVLNQNNYKVVSGTKAKAKIIRIKTYIEVEIVDIIGHENDPGVDISAILLDNNIPMNFSGKILNYVNSLKTTVDDSDYKDRKDLRNIFTCTIDGDDSKDFDDAVSITKHEDYYNLKVHIADVAHYVEVDSNLDKEALRRGTSVYVCDRVVPMLPQVISNGICSLVPNEDRLTLTCDMDINYHGEIIDYKLYESVIKSDYRMTYNDVNGILDGDKQTIQKYQDIVNIFKDMEVLSTIIRDKRFNDGAIDFEKDEAKLVLNGRGKVIDIKLRNRGTAEKLIEDFMIMANICVARHMKWLDLPCLYRIHEKPKQEELEVFINVAYLFGYKFKGQAARISSKSLQQCLDHFKDTDEYLVVKTLLLRSMSKAVYDEQCLGHYGLGLDEYAHFTSPIRRYPDLIVHRMMKKYVFMQTNSVKELAADHALMDRYGEISSINERRAVNAERSVNDMKKAEYMEDHVGDSFEGIISSVVNFGFFVELPNTIEGLIHISTLDGFFNYDHEHLCLTSEDQSIKYQLGQMIKVKCSKVSKLSGQIDFEVYKSKNKAKRRQVWI